jgi:hypothetical protein
LDKAGHLFTKVKNQWTKVLLKNSYVSLAHILSDADLHQVEKEAENTFLPDTDLNQVEMLKYTFLCKNI